MDPGPWERWPSQCPAAECPGSAIRAGKLQELLAPLGWQGQAGLNLFLKIRPLSQLLTCFSPLTPLLCLHALHISYQSFSPLPLLSPHFQRKGEMAAPSFLVNHPSTKSPSKNQNDSDTRKRKAQQTVLSLAACPSPALGNTSGPPPSRRTYWEGASLDITMAVPGTADQQLLSLPSLLQPRAHGADCPSLWHQGSLPLRIDNGLSYTNLRHPHEFGQHNTPSCWEWFLPLGQAKYFISPSVTFCKFRLPKSETLEVGGKPKHQKKKKPCAPFSPSLINSLSISNKVMFKSVSHIR